MLCSRCRRDVLGGDDHACRALLRETQMREQFEEESWCAHKWLDDRGVPRSDVGGEVFSLVGRMMRLTEINRN